MPKTLEPEVLHRSDASQNDHRSKKDLKGLRHPTFYNTELKFVPINEENSKLSQVRFHDTISAASRSGNMTSLSPTVTDLPL